MKNENERNEMKEIAVVDLGSNSFQLVIAKVGLKLHYVDKVKETVMLANGLNEEKIITKETQDLAFEAIQKFGERLVNFTEQNVKIIGTSTLRKAKNAREFIAKAESILGFPIEIISGIDEARLIYSAVSHAFHFPSQRKIVVDIGGGSTEVIVGEGSLPIILQSLELGCVSATKQFFPKGKINYFGFIEVAREIHYRLNALGFKPDVPWDIAIGSSGIIRAIDTVLNSLGVSKHGITKNGLEILIEMLTKEKSISALKLPGIKSDRVLTFLGGVGILTAIFTYFDISLMQVSEYGMREGLLFEFASIDESKDKHEETILQMMAYYRVDKEQTKRVTEFANKNLPQVENDIFINPLSARKIIKWAASLHEIGFSIAHKSYHKHSSYIISNSEMPGFTRKQQMFLNFIILNHRKSIKEIEFPFDETRDWGIVILFRLAYIFNRGRILLEFPEIKMKWDKTTFTLKVPQDWIIDRPLTLKDLNNEVKYFEEIGINYKLIFGK